MQRCNLIVLMQCLFATVCLIERTTARPQDYVLGGISEVDPNKSEYKALAKESLNKYLEDSNAKRHNQLVEIKKVTEQVVAGSLTRIDFIASPTNCELTNGSLQPGHTSCEIINPSDTITCHSEVWVKEWENFKDITVSCAA